MVVSKNYFLSAFCYWWEYLKKLAMQYSTDCFPLNDESSIDGVNEITLSWGDIGGEIVYLVSNIKKDAIGQLSNLGWIIVVFGEFCWYRFVISRYC